jgi:DNA primase
MEKYEIQKLRDLPIEGVAERIGLRVSRHKSLCPFHADHHPSLSFNRRNNTYRCFVCGAHGDTISLVMRYLGKGFVDACQWLANENNIILTEYKPAAEKEKEYAFNPEKYLRFFEHPFLNDAARHFLFDERKLDPRVIRWCRLTSWTDRYGTPWLQIPYFDENNKLTGIQNRNLKASLLPSPEASPRPSPVGKGVPTGDDKLKGEPRFCFPKGSKCGIYNLPVLNLLKPGEPLYIAEGCSDCWALLSSGHKAIAIPSATLLTEESIKLLKGIFQSDSPPFPIGEGRGEAAFHMYPDQDVPGERLFLQLKEMLSHSVSSPSPFGEGRGEAVLIRHQLPPDCKDYSEYYLKTKSK